LVLPVWKSENRSDRAFYLAPSSQQQQQCEVGNAGKQVWVGREITIFLSKIIRGRIREKEEEEKVSFEPK
jgi:hypothetical protein